MPAALSPVEIVPQRMAVTSAQVVRMIVGQKQHSTAEPILENP